MTDFGYIVGARKEAGAWHISFDRAVFLADDPEQHIRNDNPLLRNLRLAPDVQLVGTLGWAAFLGEDTSRVEDKPRTMRELVAYVNSDAGPAPFHVRYAADGRVVELREQYLP